MKKLLIIKTTLAVLVTMPFSIATIAQDSILKANEPEIEALPKAKPVKNTFQSVWIIDNQTVIVPVRNGYYAPLWYSK
jgi:hypothetical protein